MMSTSKLNTKIEFFDILLVIFGGIFALVTIFPFYNILVTSLASYENIVKYPLYWFPKSIDFTNYSLIVTDKSISGSFALSVFITLVTTVFSLFLTSMAAYVLSRKTLPFRKLLTNLIIFTMYFGGGLIPYYLLIKNLQIINHLPVLIIPGIINTWYLIIMRNNFASFGQELIESAWLDGANEFTVLFRIMLPISKPLMATMALFIAVGKWNDWYTAMLFISEPKLMPLQNVLRDIIVNQSTSSTLSDVGKAVRDSRKTIYLPGVQMAVIVFTTIPILLVYPFLQKNFAKGMMIGSIKG